MELDRLTAAVARLRLTIYLGHLLTSAGVLASPLRVDRCPATVPARIVVGDSLLIGQCTRSEYPGLAELPGAAHPHDDVDCSPEPGP